MGTLNSRRNIVAVALIATLATVTYAFVSPDATSISVVNADVPDTPIEAVDVETEDVEAEDVETEVLAEDVETEVLAEVELPMLDVDMSGFTGDIDVDLATIDPSVVVVGDYRIKYIATTDELVLGADSGGQFETVLLDLDSDERADVAIPNLAPRNGSDAVLAIPSFSKLAENDGSASFALVSATDAAAQPIPVLLESSIGDFVFADLNDNGLQDADEAGVAGVTIQLLDETGLELAQTTTDPQGNYRFTVAPGTYAIVFGAQPGTGFVERNVGDDQDIDSNATQLNGRTLPIFIGPGVENLSIDAGLTT